MQELEQGVSRRDGYIWCERESRTSISEPRNLPPEPTSRCLGISFLLPITTGSGSIPISACLLLLEQHRTDGRIRADDVQCQWLPFARWAECWEMGQLVLQLLKSSVACARPYYLGADHFQQLKKWTQLVRPFGRNLLRAATLPFSRCISFVVLGGGSWL